VLVGLLIRRGSVLKAKLRIAKRLGKARAVTPLAFHIIITVLLKAIRFTIYFKTIINARINIMQITDKDN
jgi:hypothetical protein